MRCRFVFAAFVLMGCVAACGGHRPAEPSNVGAAPTGRFEVTVLANGPGGDVEVQASGSFDDARHRFTFVTDGSGFVPVPGLDGRLALVATPEAVFVDCPYLVRLLGVPTRWISVRGAAADELRASVDRLVRGGDMRFAGGPNGDSGASVSVRYYDVGAPVAIEPPAAAEVTDETDVLNRLLGGTTGG